MDQDLELESKLISLITQIISPFYLHEIFPLKYEVAKLISMVHSMDLDAQPKPESKFMSLISQAVYIFNSMDLDSQPKPLSKLLFNISPQNLKPMQRGNIYELFDETTRLEPKPKLISLIQQIFSLVISMNTHWKKLIPICPQGEAFNTNIKRREGNKRGCLPANWEKFRLKGEESETYFLCQGCNGENHKEDNRPLVEIKHPLHPKHSLQLVYLYDIMLMAKCYCCGEDIQSVVYHCLVCNLSINFSCSEKLTEKSIDHPKRHEHTLALYPSQDSVCTACALSHSSCPFYICPPCDFVFHQSCLGLPYVIRISRHHHRISFTLSFDQGYWVCGVCREEIDNNYGGYSCIKDGCSYAAHSKCATQSNVWDGKELEGVPEETEEEILPFVKLSNGDIQHFSHPDDHHLRLDENTERDYDENKLCQACITPIYFGNFYSCIQCDFILHEEGAKLSRKIYHPIHPHRLNLVPGYDCAMDMSMCQCSACPQWKCMAGFFYNCDECHRFSLHVQCATISEPLVHESHIHPLFLTSKPGEMQRYCSVCKQYRKETFNCIECDFCMCFKCATLPQKVRYKHDKHKLILSYGEVTSTKIYWCEVCEKKIDLNGRFYMCDEYCCVTLHIECLIGMDLYMKPGSSWFRQEIWGAPGIGSSKRIQQSVDVLPNNQHMSRPICSVCKKRCPYNIVFNCNGSIACSQFCSDSLKIIKYY